MRCFRNGLKGLVVGAAVFAALGTAQAATVDGCRAFVGFGTGGGAWGAVDASGNDFLSRNGIQQCEVKVVGTSAKGKPITTTITVYGPMAKDECTMYNYLSSVDSKLNQAKNGDAYVQIGMMISKVNSLFATVQLAQPGYTAISTAATLVQTCIAELMSQ